MTEQEKQLLLVDLCAKLPYGVKVWYKYATWISKIFATSIRLAEEKIALSSKFNKEGDWVSIEEAGEILIKPYLRPMSSMTEEEVKELLFVHLSSKYGESCAYIKNFIKLNEVSFRKEPPYEGSTAVWFSFENKIHDTLQIREYSKCEYLGQINDITLAEIDWLNKKMFDYRGLIEKGLALEAPDGMYK